MNNSKKNYADKIYNLSKKMQKIVLDPSKHEEYKKLQSEYFELCIKQSKNFRPREVPYYEALLAGKFELAKKIQARNYKIEAKERRKREREAKQFHSSHRMTKWYVRPWSYSGGEPRFYSHRHCTKCNHAMHISAAGQHFDPELKKPCSNKKTGDWN